MTDRTDKQDRRELENLVSFDWIVFTAGVLGLAVVIIASVREGEHGLVGQLGSYVGRSNLF
ncbi:hypothetical protein JQV27_15275 [Sulfitobacter mediterraneus]|jgi:hypothetical protein|uniref:hypothetical protein n=1 Tax=Sulfitobacter TaxID=60136 RepID=UPI00193485A6|nr:MULTISPECIES: hypothetical protein [Sulfitobacter]MBM1634210.1 hypothetical protein [Sulfitobacter mediterraneus]MBM1642027.1 hypothetical protein [Sulfitobacter mediterraneus]MBM1646076.1 hypothetical protein [Sulfitobacter mediterraneus]MBM1650122.1 hypothetical protein [Sulfitobacter mediterraneus]MBM1654144.1 hypothetical protein [Sulfitobacter mediterraneus]